MPESDAAAHPVRVLRVIARLNMGGPALHVAYLTDGLKKRGYDTTLVAGSLARGEDSMAFVADARDVPVIRIDELGREISPLRDLVATFRLAGLIRRERPHILHTHTAKAGTVGRVAALLAGSRRPPIIVHTFHGHVLRGYFGPRQSPHSQYAAVVPLFIAAIDQGEPITIYGDGEQSRDFTYVGNVVDATLRAATAPGASGRTFNVAAGSPASVNHVAETIGLILGKSVEKRYEPPRPGDIRDSWADISAARERLGYEPTVGFEEGLRRTVEHLERRRGQD